MEFKLGLSEVIWESCFPDNVPVKARILLNPILQPLRRDRKGAGPIQKSQRGARLEAEPKLLAVFSRALPDFVHGACFSWRKAVWVIAWRGGANGRLRPIVASPRVPNNAVGDPIEGIACSDCGVGNRRKFGR